jgi:MFS family permease
MGAFWALGAVYAGRIGLAERDIALFISLTIVAGALGQWPMGRLSDTLDRRRALALIAGLAAASGVLIALLGNFDKWVLVGCVVFGAAAFAVYPVVVAHLIDHLQQQDILPGNAALLLLHGVGAAIGPALAGALMGISGAAALPVFFALMFAPAAAFAWLQSRRAADEIVEEAAHFMPMLRTSPTVLEMMSPGEDAAHGTPAQTPQPPPSHAP